MTQLKPNDPNSDLVACSREPIHIPGAIQPQGVLFFVRAGNLEILQLSENSRDFFGIAAQSLIGISLSEAIPGLDLQPLIAALNEAEPAAQSPVHVFQKTTTGETGFDILIHPVDGGFLLEFEPAPPQNAAEAGRFLREVQRAITSLQAAKTQEDLFATCAAVVARLTGFERVMVYRFDEQWNGKVVGETLLAEVESYFDLHFPASDIPEQARALYARTPVRLIPDAAYKPVPLHPQMNPLSGQPLDLSDAVLRSVSPVHLEYLLNMGVRASMSISLKRGERLWGLVACHHRAPRLLPYTTRAACELLGRVMSVQIGVQEETDRLRAQLAARSVQTRFFEFISHERRFVDSLEKYAPHLFEMMHAHGAAILSGSHWTLLGVTPSARDLDAILPGVENHAADGFFATHHLSEVADVSEDVRQIASGLLLVVLSREERNLILFFRPEVISTVTWAGNPTKAVEEGSLRLHPRKSFAAWQEKVTGRAEPWEMEEIEAALELRRAFNASIVQRTDQLLRRSEELEQRNTDLNSFAHIAAHDLKEPVRGIHHYTGFVLEDFAEQVPAQGKEMLRTVQSLAVRIDELLASLLEFSAIGRMQINPAPASLDTIVDESIALVRRQVEEAGLQIRRAGPLPTVRCNRALLREVFANFITNTIKYSDKAERWMEIGAAPLDESERTATGGPAVRIYVRDNGIGIRPKHLEDIFVIFRRLHDRERFGGGTGAGLAIVKTIIEKHGGRVWAESAPGEGTTFWFTLPLGND